uniref:Uncharacterized protein n=1 Tax=uncultured marine virus TaxID=186617 RepID=A0A0F7L3B9_9VIRU|nr:hypothetical protein [uncultured marine virus]
MSKSTFTREAVALISWFMFRPATAETPSNTIVASSPASGEYPMSNRVASFGISIAGYGPQELSMFCTKPPSTHLSHTPKAPSASPATRMAAAGVLRRRFMPYPVTTEFASTV